MDNTVTLVGNLTRDPETKVMPSGDMTARFGIAVNRKWTDKASGEEKEAVSYFTVNTWRTLAENVERSLSIGDRVIVTGQMRMREWETDTGEKRSVLEVEADAVGPDLRWAEATVSKNAKRGDQPSFDEKPW